MFKFSYFFKVKIEEIKSQFICQDEMVSIKSKFTKECLSETCDIWFFSWSSATWSTWTEAIAVAWYLENRVFYWVSWVSIHYEVPNKICWFNSSWDTLSIFSCIKWFSLVSPFIEGLSTQWCFSGICIIFQPISSE